jgi:hypothetical protein
MRGGIVIPRWVASQLPRRKAACQSPDHRSSRERSGAGEYALNAIDFDQTFSPVPARPPADAREFLYWITMNLD